MLQAGVRVARPRNGRAIAVAATLLFAVALGQANLAYAGPHVGGSFHGGAFLVGFTTASQACTVASASATVFHLRPKSVSTEISVWLGLLSYHWCLPGPRPRTRSCAAGIATDTVRALPLNLR
jgi:hypothetical protein